MFCKPCIAAFALLAALPFVAATNTAPQSPAPAASSAPSNATTWKIDDVHSMAMFRVQHFGAGMFWGRFDNVSGSITTSGEGPDSVSFDIAIDPATVSSGNEKLNGHLMSPDFFSVKEFPTMTFKSTRAEKGSDGMWTVTGDMTMHGVTKSISAKVECTGRAKMGPGERIGFEAMFNLDRSEFGMTYGIDKGAIGKSVRVIVGMEATTGGK
ncbi:MAG: YceI family protein [Planctomycetes bacterium]|nr:YceI family protein [Planctomycetota bacterium]